MVLLFLRDPRSVFDRVGEYSHFDVSKHTAIKTFRSTINIMTLGGLALAIGIFGDESTVTMKTSTGIWKWERQKAKSPLADACHEIALPKLLILLVHWRIRSGISYGPHSTRNVPASFMAVGFSMITAFLCRNAGSCFVELGVEGFGS